MCQVVTLKFACGHWREVVRRCDMMRKRIELYKRWKKGGRIDQYQQKYSLNGLRKLGNFLRICPCERRPRLLYATAECHWCLDKFAKPFTPWRTRERLCDEASCFLPLDHVGPHQIWMPCKAEGCTLHEGHDLLHRISGLSLSRDVAAKLNALSKKTERIILKLNQLVLDNMGNIGGMFVLVPKEDEPEVLETGEVPSAKTEDSQHLIKTKASFTTIEMRSLGKGKQPEISVLDEFKAFNMDESRRPRTPVSIALNDPQSKEPMQPRIPRRTPAPKRRATSFREVLWDPRDPYTSLDFACQEIRLFELFPASNDGGVEGTFRCGELIHCPGYTAVSYTWGEVKETQAIRLTNGSTVRVRENLWQFLYQQAIILSEPKLFWIDAICIDQSNIHERNHQINMMKNIYATAEDVYIWLGKEANNSDLAMDYVAVKMAQSLESKGNGLRRIWTNLEGSALWDLFERSYWRRMWIIQEIVHADRITVCCGAKRFRWESFETLYLTLKNLEDASWLAHQEHAIHVFHSSACVMVWQRAYWRHPDTPQPKLQTLIEIFRDWKCTDLRDKVFALISMSSSKTAINPDYSMTARDVYVAVQTKHPDAKTHFFNVLSQVLGVPARDVNFYESDLIEYKTHPADSLILRHRAETEF